MKFTEKLIKPITETAYLTEENTKRYRPIMRFFYEKHEQAENWLYKEDVYEALSDKIDGYTMEECQRDLDFLVSKLSLTTVQDTENANTLEKFKFKNYRYQMTDYAIEIERLTIRLEEMEVKVASLEPRLFERIKLKLKKLKDMKSLTEADLYELWMDLTIDFTNLNQSYQDFLKKFHEPKTDELLQSYAFIEHKNNLITYLNNFIREYITNSKEIEKLIVSIPQEDVDYFMDSLISYQKKAPKIRPDFDFDYLREVNIGKWKSLRKWFVKENDICEGERLLKATNNIIAKITKYASSLIELHGNMMSRKEEYKFLCQLFDKQETLKESHNLISAIMGVYTVRHFKGISELNSDSILSSWDVDPIEIIVDKMKRGVKKETIRVPIVDKSFEKERLIQEYKKQEEKEKQMLEHLIKDDIIILKGTLKISKEERRYLFTLLEKSEKGKGIDPVFGKKYEIKKEKGSCILESSDGIFKLDSFVIVFGG